MAFMTVLCKINRLHAKLAKCGQFRTLLNRKFNMSMKWIKGFQIADKIGDGEIVKNKIKGK